MPDQPPIDQPRTDPANAMTPLGSQVSTDRPCASCGFNLFGQMLHREPVYKLVVARCPECGTIASLQEYPAMSGWVGRWKLLLTVLWVLMLLGALIGNFAASAGLNHATNEVASQNYADLLGIQYAESIDQPSTNPLAARWTNLDYDWTRANAPRILKEMGGAFAGANREFLIFWTGASIAMFAFGVFWSVVLFGARRRSAMLLPGIAIIGASGAVLTNLLSAGWLQGIGAPWAKSVAEQGSAPTMVPLTALVMLVAAGLGVLLGRKLSRVAIVLMLPPRLRTPLAILWTRDGLNPPKPCSY